MAGLMNMIHGAFDLFFRPFEGLDPFWGMLAISAVTGVLMVLIYKYTSDQAGIALVKDKIKGHLLETWIYREQVGVMLGAQAKVIRANLVYMWLNLKPLAVMLVPVLLILIDLNFRYGLEPVPPGEAALIESVRAEAVPLEQMDESLVAPEGVTIETPPVRIESEGKTYWRVSAAGAGKYTIEIKAGGIDYAKSFEVGGQGPRIAPLRSSSVLDQIFYPGETAMPSDGPLTSIEVAYPVMSPAIPGTKWRPHWIIQYFIISIIFGFIFKGPLKVEI